MPLEDILLRFRRVWAPPGPVMGQAGVPADLQARVEDELRELTALLASIDEEGKAVLRAADEEAAKIIARAGADAASAIEEAQRTAPEVRAAGAALRIKDRQAATDSLLARAHDDAAQLRDRARERMDGFISAAVSRTFASLAEESDARIVGRG
jgi:cell division septum initiation protein DivIVA